MFTRTRPCESVQLLFDAPPATGVLVATMATVAAGRMVVGTAVAAAVGTATVGAAVGAADGDALIAAPPFASCVAVALIPARFSPPAAFATGVAVAGAPPPRRSRS